MPKNKILDEFISNKYDNREKNYNLIISKINQNIYMKNRIFNIVAVLFIIILVGVTGSSIYAKKSWDNEYKEYKERKIINSKTAISDETKNEYVQNLDMNYIYQDGIGIKIDTLLLTDDCFQIDINFEMTDKEKTDYSAFEFGYAIYDEENTIYAVSERLKYGLGEYLNYKKKLCRELGLKYNDIKSIPVDLAIANELNTISIKDGNVSMRLKLDSYNGFTKSEKIYIRIFDIGYALANFIEKDNNKLEITDAEDFSLSKSEWQFEIGVPNHFYDRISTELKFAENIEDFELEKATLSETGLIVHLKHKYTLIDMLSDTITVSDEFGNIYNCGAGMSDDYVIKCIFSNLSKNDLGKKIYLNIDIPELNINKRLELVKK